MNLYKIGIVLLVFGACTQKKNSADTLILCTNATYPPYESIGSAGEPIGFDIDLGELLAQKLHKKLHVQEMAFDALILGLDQGKCDLILSGLSITASRQKEIALIPYQGEVSKSYYLIFWDKIQPGIQSAVDVARVGNKTIAVQIGTWMEDYLKKIPGISVKALESTPELVMEVQHHKSVASFLEPHIAHALMKSNSHIKGVKV